MLSNSLYADKITIEIQEYKGRSWPQYEFNMTGSLLYEKIIDDDTRTKTFEFKLTGNEFVIDITGKSEKETILREGKIIKDQYISINSISINDILLEKFAILDDINYNPVYSQSQIDYAAKFNIDLSYNIKEWDLRYNGKFVFKIVEPFFMHYHGSIHDQTERFNHWFKRSHLGIPAPWMVDRMKALLGKLS